MSIERTLSGVICVAVFVWSASASDTIRACVQKEIDDGMFLGAVVTAGRPGKVLFCEAFGQRDLGKRMSTDCLFDVASITKVVTVATALAITMEKHPEVSLEQRVQKYLPSMNGKGADRITIRNTAAHRSGLDNTKELCSKFAGEELVVKIMSRDTQWEVGSRYEYSCLGIIRLGEVIASINGCEFGAYCREKVFVPLGMTNTYFSPVPQGVRERCVATDAPLGVVADPNARGIGRPVGNAGVFTTAQDLAKLAELWLQRGQYAGTRLFSPAICDEFTSGSIVWHSSLPRDHKPSFPLPRNVSSSTFYHSGYTGQLLIVDPERSAYVIVLTAWLHPSIKASYEDSRKARGRIAAAVIATHLGDETRH